MTTLFRLLAIVLVCYVAYSLATGAVYAKPGFRGRTFRRSQSTLGYWCAIVGYTLLIAMLFFVF